MHKTIKNTMIYWLVRAGMGFFHLVGFLGSLSVGRRLGKLTFRLLGRERRITLDNLAKAFPEKTPSETYALGRQIFEHFGMAVAECVNIDKLPAGYVNFEPESRKVMEEALACGKGLVYITCHSGNWELMARSLTQMGFPMNAIGQKSYDPRFTRLIAGFREAGRVRTVWRGESRILEKMMEVLQRGEVLGLLIDQDTRVPGVFVPFFGRPAHTPTAAALMARISGAKVVCGFIYRWPDGGYRIRVEPFQPCALPQKEQAIEQDTRSMTARIESHVRQYPAEWVWMHKRWKTTPKGSPEASAP